MKISQVDERNQLPLYLAANKLRTGAELGVAAGAFSERILLGTPEVERLYSVDRWAGDRKHGVEENLRALERLSRFGERSIVLRSSFEDALPGFPDQSLDFVYVDGYAHTGQEGGQTLEDWFPKVIPGGLFGGHDYDAKKWPKTVEAVDAFREKRADEIETFHVTGEASCRSWFIVKRGRVRQRQGDRPPSRGLTTPDENALKWGGARGSREILRSPFRGAPMFFRENGSPVEILDTYQDAGLFLCLNGPSLAEQFPEKTCRSCDRFARLRRPGVVTMAVNNGGHEVRPDLWTSVDDPSRFMASIWRDPRIRKFIPAHHFEKVADGGRLVKDHPNVLGYRRNEKFTAHQFLDEQTINWGNHKDYGGGRSVMLVALRIAHLLGFRRVYLLGCDFRMSESEGYFFDEDRTPQAVRNNMNSYQLLRGYFAALRPFFLRDGFQVFNCSPGSALDVFPHLELDQALELETSRIPIEASTLGMYHGPAGGTGSKKIVPRDEKDGRKKIRPAGPRRLTTKDLD